MRRDTSKIASRLMSVVAVVNADDAGSRRGQEDSLVAAEGLFVVVLAREDSLLGAVFADRAVLLGEVLRVRLDHFVGALADLERLHICLEHFLALNSLLTRSVLAALVHVHVGKASHGLLRRGLSLSIVKGQASLAASSTSCGNVFNLVVLRLRLYYLSWSRSVLKL